MKLMKIVLLANASSTHSIRWANALSDKNIQVTLVTQHNVKEGLSSKVNVINLPFSGSKGYILNICALKSSLKSIEYDLLHVHFASGYGTLAYLSGLKYIVSVWGSDVYRFPRKGKLNKFLLRKVLNKADLVLSTSKAMAEETKLYFNGEIKITPFGVDVKKYNINKTSSNLFRIGLIKVIEKRYGIDVLLRAYKDFIERYSISDCILVIAGDGPNFCDIKRLSEKLGLSENIKFLGWVKNEETPFFFRDIDLLVVPSREESFGVVAVEGLASRTPVIASNVGGLPEVIDHEVTGLIFESENYKQLSDLIFKIYIDRNITNQLTHNGFLKANDEYNWDDNVNLMISIYSRLLTAHE